MSAECYGSVVEKLGFPAYPQYKGSGDPKQASSFACVARPALSTGMRQR